MLTLTATMAFSQEAAPFLEKAPEPWKPSWELTIRDDRLSDPEHEEYGEYGEYGPEGFQRLNLQLRLRWSWEWKALSVEAGLRAAAGSDGNRFNAPRWDNQPSNGTQVDVARAAYSWTTERSFGTLSLGFQESGLLAPQALWDPNFRILGGRAMAGFRSTDGLLQEASLRGVAGRVRTILGGRVDLAAGQAVLKLDTGPWSWTAHAGRWSLSWDPGRYRLSPLPGGDAQARQRMVVDAAGASARWNTILPLEARWSATRNPDTGETSEEWMAAAGSRERVYWPQVSFIWQRLSSTGTLYPVNGDEWWYYRSARGPRVDVSLPFPGRWVATFSFIRQTLDGDDHPTDRTMLVLMKRF